MIIIAILAILIVIAAEVYPLFQKPEATPLGGVPTQTEAGPLAIGTDEYREFAYLVTPTGVLFVPLNGELARVPAGVAEINEARVVATSTVGRGPFALGLSDGRVIPVEAKFNVSFVEGARRVEPELVAGEPIVANPEGRPIKVLAHTVAPSGPITAAAVGPKDIALITVQERKALIGGVTKEEARSNLSLPIEGEISALIVDGRGDNLFVGTSAGEVVRVDLREPADPKPARAVLATSQPRAGVTAMGFLLGDRTLVVGDVVGGVSSWQLLSNGDDGLRLTKIYDFTAHDEPVVAFAASQRDKGFATADSGGTIYLRYGTTGQTLLTVRTAEQNTSAVNLTPKSDGLVAVDIAGRLSHWSVANPHPEVTWRSLFGKVWYEGYSEPAYVWQSTGGTDDFEAKLSLTPLLCGTLKGTFYAMLFAGPIALLAALYASQFMHPSLKGVVKPTVEIMAALPSVVLGFIAGLWLAPKMEKLVPGIFLMPVVLLLMIPIALFFWRLLPAGIRDRLKPGTELFLLVPVVLAAGCAAFWLGGLVESGVLGGDYRNWLRSALGMTFDQRNSLVVGFAMGFAVIPLIFTIAEESLSSVPRHLTAGSLALGANRWQTAIRIVLPTASPGIFSAMMIGFGRAVGETMIVLMATGNTPIMDWSPFNGFRALSANVAVELPEAPAGGTLYRVLFLAALLLFLMTSVVNTVAELVRLKLRQKYRYL